MGLIDDQLETISNDIHGKNIKLAIIEALDILDENLPFIPLEEEDN